MCRVNRDGNEAALPYAIIIPLMKKDMGVIIPEKVVSKDETRPNLSDGVFF